MKRGQRFFYSLLFPSTRLLPRLTVPLLTAIPLFLLRQQVPAPLIAVGSLLCVYVLLVLAARLPQLARAGIDYFMRTVHLPWRERWAVLSLFGGLIINFAYAVFKILTGAQYRAAGLGSEAVLYIVLGAIRISLLGEEHTEPDAEPTVTVRCGRLLLLLSLCAIATVAELACSPARAPFSPLVVVITALYTVSRLFLCVFSLFRAHKHARPLHTAIRTLNLAAALLSAFSLLAIGLTRSGLSPNAQRVCNLSAGGGVLLCLFALSFSLLVKRGKT